MYYTNSTVCVLYVKFTGVSVKTTGGIAGGVVLLSLFVLVCGFVAGVVAVYLLRRRKMKKRQRGTE